MTTTVTEAEAQYLAALSAGPLETPADEALLSLHGKGLAFAEGTPETGLKWFSLDWWLAQNAGLVYSAVNRVAKRYPEVDRDDLASVIRVKVALCVRTFRPIGIRFQTYAILAGERDAREYAARSRFRGVHVAAGRVHEAGVCPAVGSMGEIGDRADWEPAAPEEVAPPDYSGFWESAVEGLGPKAAMLLLGHYRDGKTYRELAAVIGVSKERVRQLLVQARAEIYAAGSLSEWAA